MISETITTIDEYIDDATVTLEPDNRFLLVRQIQAVHDCDVIDEVPLEGTFRLKHAPLSRSHVHSFRLNGVIREGDNEMGTTIDWEFSELGKIAVKVAREIDEEDVPLSKHQYKLFRRHRELCEELPSRDETFVAREYEMNGSLLAALRRHGFLDREEKHPGQPDVWRVSELTDEFRSWLAE